MHVQNDVPTSVDTLIDATLQFQGKCLFCFGSWLLIEVVNSELHVDRGGDGMLLHFKADGRLRCFAPHEYLDLRNGEYCAPRARSKKT